MQPEAGAESVAHACLDAKLWAAATADAFKARCCALALPELPDVGVTERGAYL